MLMPLALTADQSNGHAMVSIAVKGQTRPECVIPLGHHMAPAGRAGT